MKHMKINYKEFLEVTNQLAEKNGELLVNLLSEKDEMDIHPIDFESTIMAISINTARQFESQAQ